jgi:hypothetical protein
MGKARKKEYELEVYFPQVPSELEEFLHSQGFETKGDLPVNEAQLEPLGCWKSWKGEVYVYSNLSVKINYFIEEGMSLPSTIADRKGNWCQLYARLIISTPSKGFTQEMMEMQETIGRLLRDKYHALLYDPQFKMEVED